MTSGVAWCIFKVLRLPSRSLTAQRNKLEQAQESKSSYHVKLLKNLSEAQRRAVLHRDGPLLILAGPGSGKTRIITHRVAYLVSEGVQPENILALTFTNKAAKEMSKRIVDLIGPGRVTICTFHSLCARLLREFASELSLSANFSIFDRADSAAALREAVIKSDLDPKNWPPATTGEVISQAKSNLLSPGEYEKQADNFFKKQIAKIYNWYQKILTANEALDFDDLLVRMVSALRENESIRSRLANRYKYVLVDEYQDTNRAQYVIGRVLCRDHQNICATGDPDQSIYGWRGADISNILDFEQDFPNAKIIRLEQNYRSTKRILSVADGLIKINSQRREKELWTQNQAGELLDVICCPDDRSEAEYLASRICEYVEQGGRYDDVAIFYRVNSLSRLVEQALRSAGIPYQMVRGTAFYSRKEIKNVLAYLRVMVNPKDSVSLLRIINVPARQIGNKTVKLLQQYSELEDMSVLDALAQVGRIEQLPNRAARAVRQFAQLLKELSEGPQRPVKTVLENVIRRTGLRSAYAKERSVDKSATENVDELISSAAQYDLDNPQGDLEDYLQQTALISDVDALDSESGVVALMTLHAAKGLEFPKVFMIGLEEGLLPHGRSLDNPPEMEEERRLCFVGITRTQQHLTLSYARYRQLRGTTNRTVPSPFLAELPTEALCLISLEEETTPHRPVNWAGPAQSQTPARPAKKLLSKFGSKPNIKQSVNQGAKRRAGRAKFIAELVQGSAVYHPRLGLGKIKEISREGKFTRAVINFQQGGSKTMMLEYADLREVND